MSVLRRAVVPLALGLSSLAALACGPKCGDVVPGGGGSVTIIVNLPPQSQVTPPETIVVSSPVQVTGMIDESDRPTPGPGSPGSFWASIHEDAGGARLLFISWTFVALDQNSPPGDQFVATVTDAAGQVTGETAETGTYRWTAATDCYPGHWEYEGLAN